MIKGIGLTVILGDIKSERSFSVFENFLLKNLSDKFIQESCQKYTKIPNAYKLEYFSVIDENVSAEKVLYQMNVIAGVLAMPWLVYFDKQGNNTEMIFNKTENTYLAHENFSNIIWAHLQLIY